MSVIEDRTAPAGDTARDTARGLRWALCGLPIDPAGLPIDVAFPVARVAHHRLTAVVVELADSVLGPPHPPQERGERVGAVGLQRGGLEELGDADVNFA